MAKKKSNDDWKKEGDEVKALFNAAKKKEHNCAIYICAEGLAIEADPRLPLEALAKKAKKRDGATPKGVIGKLNVQGSSIEFKCLEEPPGGLDSKFKQYLQKIGVRMLPVIIPPGEEAADAKTADKAGAEEEPGAKADKADEEPSKSEAAGAPEEAEEASGSADDPAYSKERVTADFKHVAEVLKLSFDSMDEKQADDLKAAMKAIGGAIKSGDLIGARNMLNKLQLLTGVGPDSPMQPITMASKEGDKGDAADGEDLKAQKKRLTGELAALSPELKAAIDRASSKNKQDLQDLAKTFAAQLKSDDVAGAENSMTELKARLSEIAAAHEAQDKARAARGGRMAKLSRNIQTLMNELA